MKRIINKIAEYRLFCYGLCCVLGAKLVYLLNATANVPIMDYWRYARKMLYKIYNGGITFSDLWEPINGQRGFLNHLLFFLNVKFFHWNTRVEIFGGMIVVLFSTIFLFCLLKKDINFKDSFQAIVLQIEGLLIAIIMFNYQQWEIETLEFSLSFSISVASFIIIAWLTNEILSDERFARKYIYIYCVFLLISICFIMSAFFSVMVLSVCAVGSISFISKNKDMKLIYLRYYLMVLLTILISMFFYFYGMTGMTGEGYSVKTFLQSLTNGVFLKSFLYYLSGSLIHVSDSNISIKYYSIGFFVLLLYLGTLIYYFKKNIYEKCLIPAIFIMYTLFAGTILIYARGLVFDVEYLASSRYAYQSKIGLIGVVWVMQYLLIDVIEKKKLIYVGFYFVVCAVIVYLNCTSFMQENEIAKYRRIYGETAIEYIKYPNQMEESDYAIFQDTKENVEVVIPLMKEYKLGIFHY